jgi:xylulokinase
MVLFALTGFTLPKLVWVRTHEPDRWRRVKSVLLPKDYVRYRLTGEKATDVADASGTLLFDVGKRVWSGTMLDEMQIDASLMPRAYEAPEGTGTVSADGAKATGLKAARPLSPAAATGRGAVGMGSSDRMPRNSRRRRQPTGARSGGPSAARHFGRSAVA